MNSSQGWLLNIFICLFTNQACIIWKIIEMKTGNWDPKKSNKGRPDESSQPEHARNIQIDNYYGAHKNFKTDFRNKKYRNVYSLLTHRKPSQAEYMSLYYQDLLIAIIKILEGSLLSKENRIESIEPYFYFGSKAIAQFYWLFLRERRLIGRELTINPLMRNKISNFLTLTIDFSCKIAQYLGANGNRVGSETIYKLCYESIIVSIVNSSTSNVLLLKKCGQFLLHYAAYCLKSEQVELAHHLLKEGLMTQLNQLILLKSSFMRRKKQKKYLSRYCGTLKCLTHYYLILAMLYEKKSRMYQCATVVLDSVVVQELICTIKTKTKKWICNLEESYLEQKNKCVELRRICQTFFTSDYLASICEGIKEIRQKVTNESKSALQSSKYDKIYYCTNGTQETNQRQERKQGKANNKTHLLKGVKQVRFQINEESVQGFKHQGKEVKELNNSNAQSLCTSQSKKQFLQPAATSQEINSPSSLKEDVSENVGRGDPTKIIKLKSKSMTSNREEQENSEFLLFGETFWKSDKKILTTKSKSIFIKPSCLQQHKIKVKSSERSTSFNMGLLQAGLVRNKQEIGNQTKCLKLFLKQNYQGSDLKKRMKKDHGVLFRKKNNPDSYANVEDKMLMWHNKSQKLDNDVKYKIQRLVQKKQLKNGNQIGELAQSSSAEDSPDQDKCAEIYQIESNIRNAKKQESKAKKSKKLSGVSLFKQFLIDNRAFFSISKLELFNPNQELEQDRKFTSFLTGDKGQNFEKLVERNHWQAKNNVNFFINEIECSNKKLRNKNNGKPLEDVENKLSSSNHEFELGERLKSLQKNPTKLFTTSLKTRVCEMINYI